jgi:hypothetical protein
MSVYHALLAVALALALHAASPAEEQRANRWIKLPHAEVVGQRTDIPLAFAPGIDRFFVLGGRTHYREYREEARSYDQLALDLEQGQWENWFPAGQTAWGPRFGAAQAPPWNDELWHFQDAAGNVRPNWTVYGTFSLGRAHAYDPVGQRFIFYAGGTTFSYDPALRTWHDLQPATHPTKDTGGELLWTSLCYDPVNMELVLYGGGNVQTQRGDPGTWVYRPADNTWSQLSLTVQPPVRANSQLAYDPQSRHIVLFGGDRLDQLLADTWAYDVITRTWRQLTPELSPAPRAGHALLWLPVAKKLLLVGGYDYASEVGYVGQFYRLPPFEMWTFDLSANRWELIQHASEGAEVPDGASPVLYAYAPLSAACDDKDNVLVVNRGNTWKCRVDAAAIDAPGRLEFGVPPGTTTGRTGPYDPAWYREDVPPADPDALERELQALPPNQWHRRATPKLPRPNVDWGTAVFAPDLDLILRYSGGHSAYCGTAPHVYDVKTDRYSIPFAPEIPLEYVGTNDQVGGEWSFQGNPWMTAHTYKSTGYDPLLRSLVFAAHDYTYFFDPQQGRWTRSAQRNPHDGSCFTVTLCSTPEGVVCWAEKPDRSLGLWRMDAQRRAWVPLPVDGPLPAQRPDSHGMVFDSQRNRLLLISMADENQGDVLDYDLHTGKSAWLQAGGRDRAVAPARESVYLPDQDAVLVGARVEVAGRWCWLLYDCAANAWFALDLQGDDPIEEGSFNNSIGLMYDPQRQLVWAAGQNSHIHVLRANVALGVHAL